MTLAALNAYHEGLKDGAVLTLGAQGVLVIVFAIIMWHSNQDPQ